MGEQNLHRYFCMKIWQKKAQDMSLQKEKIFTFSPTFVMW